MGRRSLWSTKIQRTKNLNRWWTLESGCRLHCRTAELLAENKAPWDLSTEERGMNQISGKGSERTAMLRNNESSTGENNM